MCVCNPYVFKSIHNLIFYLFKEMGKKSGMLVLIFEKQIKVDMLVLNPISFRSKKKKSNLYSSSLGFWIIT